MIPSIGNSRSLSGRAKRAKTEMVCMFLVWYRTKKCGTRIELVRGMHVITTVLKQIDEMQFGSCSFELDIRTWNCSASTKPCELSVFRSPIFKALTERQFYLCVCFSFDSAIIYIRRGIYVHYRIDVDLYNLNNSLKNEWAWAVEAQNLFVLQFQLIGFCSNRKKNREVFPFFFANIVYWFVVSRRSVHLLVEPSAILMTTTL